MRVGKATTVSNGTVALHLALHALGIGPGDEVILPTLTYVASANAVAYVGAKPIFADSDIDTWESRLGKCGFQNNAKNKGDNGCSFVWKSL